MNLARTALFGQHLPLSALVQLPSPSPVRDQKASLSGSKAVSVLFPGACVFS